MADSLFNVSSTGDLQRDPVRLPVWLFYEACAPLRALYDAGLRSMATPHSREVIEFVAAYLRGHQISVAAAATTLPHLYDPLLSLATKWQLVPLSVSLRTASLLLPDRATSMGGDPLNRVTLCDRNTERFSNVCSRPLVAGYGSLVAGAYPSGGTVGVYNRSTNQQVELASGISATIRAIDVFAAGVAMLCTNGNFCGEPVLLRSVCVRTTLPVGVRVRIEIAVAADSVALSVSPCGSLAAVLSSESVCVYDLDTGCCLFAYHVGRESTQLQEPFAVDWIANRAAFRQVEATPCKDHGHHHSYLSCLKVWTWAPVHTSTQAVQSVPDLSEKPVTHVTFRTGGCWLLVTCGRSELFVLHAAETPCASAEWSVVTSLTHPGMGASKAVEFRDKDSKCYFCVMTVCATTNVAAIWDIRQLLPNADKASPLRKVCSYNIRRSRLGSNVERAVPVILQHGNELAVFHRRQCRIPILTCAL